MYRAILSFFLFFTWLFIFSIFIFIFTWSQLKLSLKSRTGSNETLSLKLLFVMHFIISYFIVCYSFVFFLKAEIDLITEIIISYWSANLLYVGNYWLDNYIIRLLKIRTALHRIELLSFWVCAGIWYLGFKFDIIWFASNIVGECIRCLLTLT